MANSGFRFEERRAFQRQSSRQKRGRWQRLHQTQLYFCVGVSGLFVVLRFWDGVVLCACFLLRVSWRLLSDVFFEKPKDFNRSNVDHSSF